MKIGLPDYWLLSEPKNAKCKMENKYEMICDYDWWHPLNATNIPYLSIRFIDLSGFVFVHPLVNLSSITLLNLQPLAERSPQQSTGRYDGRCPVSPRESYWPPIELGELGELNVCAVLSTR